MKITAIKRFLPVVAGVICLGLISGYRIADHITENKVRAEQLAGNSRITVETMAASLREMQEMMIFSAGLEPEWITEISAKGDGRIVRIDVKEGETIEGGTVAMLLDNSDAQAQILQAQGNLLAARSNLEQAELDYGRYLVLQKDDAVAVQVLDNARTKRDAVRGQVQTAEGALALAQDKADNLQIMVPRSGVVTKRHLQEGAYVRSGTALLTVADTTALLAKATIGQSQIAQLSVGTQVKIQIDALKNEAFIGMITMIAPVADLPARTFSADILIDNRAGRLKAGMFAKVEIPLNERRAVIAVPESAIVLREDQPSLYVLQEGQYAVQRIIQTGIAENGWIEVVEGLQEGEIFVVGGQNKLRDGMAVNGVNRGEKA